MSRSRRRPARAALPVLLAAVVAAVPLTLPPGAAAAVPSGAPGGYAVLRHAPGGSGAPVDSAGPVFPRPGGGPRAIHTLTAQQTSYLLDPHTGTYREFPYPMLLLSPNGRTVAVEAPDGRVGVAARAGLLRAGESAVRWTELPGGAINWSPDGTALLTTTPDKQTRRIIINRYDLASGALRYTAVTFATSGAAGWAADSRRYVVRLPGPDPEIPDGPMRYVEPDGSPGPLVGASGHIWDAEAYSPSRRYVIVEPARGYPFPPEPAPWQYPRILDLDSGRLVATITTDWPLLGWYDERRVVRVAPGPAGQPTTLEVVDVATGQVIRRVPAPGLPAYRIQLGSSAGLCGPAALLGF